MTTLSTASGTDTHFQAFRDTLEATGVRSALAYLLSLSEYRFIGIFQLIAGYAHALVYFDRDNPQVEAIDAVVETAAYCCFVRDSLGPLLIGDALRDPRFEHHVAKSNMRSYCGIPIMDPEGNLQGTLCHYDTEQRDPDHLDLPLLLQVASALAYGKSVAP